MKMKTTDLETESKIQTLSPETEASVESRGISLLDLAEVLDQHKIWAESGGESGAKADLCGVNLSNADLTGANLQGALLNKANLRGADLSLANLRGTSLVQADLRDTNLLGTELRGANLMGATLYGAEGLWVGRLGGTNLFDAMLPEAAAAFDGAKAIAQATRYSRWIYFLILGTCAICLALIAFTSDTRLILNASAIPIARLSTILPMSGFYLGAPIFILLMYLRFHFLLLRLWGNMAALPAVFIDGDSPEKDGPWFLMGLVRRHFRWQRDYRSPISMLEAVMAMLLGYWVAPVTLCFFWLRYLPRQDLRGTLLHVLLIALSVAAASCLPTIVSRVLRPGDLQRTKSKHVLPVVLATLRVTLITGAALFLLSFGVIRGMPAEQSIAPEMSSSDIRRWASQALQFAGYRPYPDVTEALFSSFPIHNDWSDEGIKTIHGARLDQVNLRYARAYHTYLVNARLWRANLEGAYLSEADLRGANLREVILRDAVLDRALAKGAVLVSTEASRANFTGADLRGADISYGTLDNAKISNAKLAGASLYAANLRNTQFLRSDLSRADLRDTKLEQSVLSFANLEQTDLSSAKLTGANLSGAFLKGTILLDADLTSADLRGATLAGAILRGSDLTGANLAGADLREAVGITATQLCSAHWRGALLDPELLAAVQSQCGTTP